MTSYLLDRKLLLFVSLIIAVFLFTGLSEHDLKASSISPSIEAMSDSFELSESADSGDTDSRSGLQKDLLAYYRLDRGMQKGYSIGFENGQMIQVEDSSDIDLSSDFALSTWVRPNEHDGTLFGKDNAYTFYFNDELDFYNWADSSRLECRVGNVSIDEWTHVVAVWDGDQKKIYTNGELCASESSEDFPVNNKDLGIGARPPDTDFALNGSLYDPRIYNRSISPAEIRDLYQGVDIGREKMLHYRFEEGTENCDLNSTQRCIRDISGRANDGRPENFGDNLWNSGEGWATGSPQNPLSFRDYSVNSYNATLYGGSHGRLNNFAFNSSSGWTGGVRNGAALKFTEGDRVDEIDNKELVEAYNDGRELTVNLWFRVDEIHTTTRWNDMIEFGDNINSDGDTSNGGVRLERHSDMNDSLAFYTRQESGNNQYQIGRVEPYEEGGWHMATMVMDYSGSGEARTYLDGELVNSRSDPGDTWDMEQGTMEIYPQGGWADFTMDELRFYSRDLSDSEIESLYEDREVRDGLVGKWGFDRGERNKTYDTASSSSGVLGTDTVSFDGEEDYVEIKDFPSIESSMSVSAWIRSTAGDTYTASWSAVSRYSQFILGPESGEMSFIVHTPSDGWTYLDPPETPNKDRWHHFVGTWNSSSGTVQLWRDGELVKERKYAPDDPEPDTGPIDIGHRETNSQGTNHLQAKIDEVRIYNRTLSKQEIKKLAFQ